jgi:hypothetical protein
VAARREAAAVAAITKEAPGMAAVGGPDMPGAGGVVIIHIGAILIGAGAVVTGAAGVAVTGGAGAAVTGGAVTHGVGVAVTRGVGAAVTGTSRIWLTNHTKWLSIPRIQKLARHPETTLFFVPLDKSRSDCRNSRVFRSCPLDGTDETQPFYAGN